MAINQSRGTAAQLLPIRSWLSVYDRSWLRPDIIAALTTWALVVPQAIAYGQLAGLPPEAGLYTAFASLLAYAIFGTSRQLIVSPTSSTAMISAVLIAPLAAGDVAQFVSLSSMLALVLGVVFVAYGLLRLGFVSQFIATSVQVGMMFGLGLTIISTQIPKLMGIPEVDGTFVDQMVNIVRNASQANLITLALGATCLAALLLFKRFRPRFPAALVVVAGSILVVTLLQLPSLGVDVIGRIDTSLPLPALPRAGFSDIMTMLGGALVLSIIGYAESDTVAEEFADKHNYEVDPNQELVALGASNIAAGLYQGFIVAGGASQTAANESAGAKSQLSGLIVAGLIFLTAIALMPLFTNLAQTVLAAIVISAVIGFINVPALRRIQRLRRDSFILSLIALFGVLILGVLPGLILALLISVALLLLYFARPDVRPLGKLPDHNEPVSFENFPEAQAVPGLLVIRSDAPLLSINAQHVRREVKSKARAMSPVPGVVIMDLSMTSELDIEGVDTLMNIHGDLAEEGAELWLAQPRSNAMDMIERSGALELIGREHVYMTTGEAIAAYTANLPLANAAGEQPDDKQQVDVATDKGA